MLHYICEINCTGYEKLALYDSYDDADANLDKFCTVYPNGYLDILSEDEIIHADQQSDLRSA